MYIRSMPACPSRARSNLGGSSRRLVPTHTRTRARTHTHTRAHTHTHTRARMHAHAHTHAPAREHGHAHARRRTHTHTHKHTHTHAHAHAPAPAPAPAPARAPGATPLDNPQDLAPQTKPEGSSPGKPMLWAPRPAAQPGRVKANRLKARAPQDLNPHPGGGHNQSPDH